MTRRRRGLQVQGLSKQGAQFTTYLVDFGRYVLQIDDAWTPRTLQIQQHPVLDRMQLPAAPMKKGSGVENAVKGSSIETRLFVAAEMQGLAYSITNHEFLYAQV